MVNARTYPLWRDLAMSEDLPKEALKTVIEALCAPARCPSGFDARCDQWREEALKAALPALLARTSAKRCGAGSWSTATRSCSPHWRPRAR